MFYLKELNIEKYFLLKEPAHLIFDRKVNYLTGKNGSGKSTLLEFILSVCSLRLNAIDSGNRPLEFTAKFHYCSEDNAADISLKLKKMDSTDDDFARLLAHGRGDSALYAQRDNTGEFHFELEMNSNDDTIYICSTASRQLRITYANEDYNFPFEPDSIALSILQTTINNINLSEKISSKLYEAIDEAFLTLIGNIGSSRFTEDLNSKQELIENSINILHNRLKDPRINEYQILGKHLIDKDVFFKKFLDNLERDSNAEYYSFDINDSELLKSTAEELSFKNIRLNYHLESQKSLSQLNSYTLNISSISVTLNNGEKVQYRDLSYGEKRYITAKFHWHTNKKIRLVDEPVNGLHHGLIENIFGWIKESDCQVFIANQNPVLFDFIHFKTDEQFKSQMIFCQNQDHDISWSNPGDEQVSHFMKDYRKNFLNVSTIMKFQELW